MITSLTKELINGALKLIQTIKYSNGTTVKRVIDPHSGLPIEILGAK